MSSVTVPAFAKINLTLDVLGRRDDGYHDIRSVMQTVALHDTVTVTVTSDSPGVRFSVTGDEAAGVPGDESNIVHRAAVRLQKIAAARGTLPGNRSGLHIVLIKRIPSQAGLGGGSSDAAATLKAVNGLFGLGLSHARLTEVATALGADVPFFLTGGTARVEGLGEKVTPLPSLPDDWWAVIVKPPVGVATARAYAALDADQGRIPDEATLAWGRPRMPGQPMPLGNDFQPTILGAYPEIALAYDALSRTDGHGPLLCGSGAAIFMLFPQEADALRAAAHVLGVRVGKVWMTPLQRSAE